MDSWPLRRVDVSDWPVDRVEQAGSNTNLWLTEASSQQRWLHKDTVIPSNGAEQGEDWSEVLSTRIAESMHVPRASTMLCTRDGRRGSISLSVVPAGYALWEGNVWLARDRAIGYFPHHEGAPGIDPSRRHVKRPGHNLFNIKAALDGAVPPEGFGIPEPLTAFDTLTGYLVLDALIANPDRHEQNWAVLVPQLLTSPVRLAPSYDHASSLGYNLSDERRLACLSEPSSLSKWAEKGTAHRFEHEAKPETLVAFAKRALDMCSEEGAEWWRAQVAQAEFDVVLDALSARAVGEMSVAATKFAHDLLVLNLRRLRDAFR